MTWARCSLRDRGDSVRSAAEERDAEPRAADHAAGQEQGGGVLGARRRR